MAGGCIEKTDLDAYSDRKVPVARRIYLRHHHNAAAIIYGEVAGLARSPCEMAHHGNRLRDEAAYRGMLVGKREQLQAELIAIAGRPMNIAAPDQPIEHPIDLIRTAPQSHGDLDLGKALIAGGQEFQDVQSLVQCRRTIAIGGLFRQHGHSSFLAAPAIRKETSAGNTTNKCIYAALAMR